MKPLVAKFLLALCALLVLPAFAPAAEAATGKGSLLYVQESAGGSVQRLGKGAFRLRLTGVSPRVSTFTDRPRRRAGSERLNGFVGRWGANGFAADPPNAALVLDRAPRSRDVALLTLSHPRYDRGRDTLTYRATPLRGEDAGALASFADRGDAVRAGEFGAASLFVDDGGGAAFVSVSLFFTEVAQGQTISIHAAPLAGGSVAWSLGLPGRDRSTLSIAGGTNGIPLTSFTVGGPSLVLATAVSEGGTSSFAISLALELESTQGVTLSATAPGGGLITAVIPTQTGPETQVLGPGPTVFGDLSPY